MLNFKAMNKLLKKFIGTYLLVKNTNRSNAPSKCYRLFASILYSITEYEIRPLEQYKYLKPLSKNQ